MIKPISKLLIITLIFILSWPVNASADKRIGGEDDANLKMTSREYLKTSADKNLNSLAFNDKKRNLNLRLNEVNYYYCLLSPKLVKPFVEFCEENRASYEFLTEFKQLMLWKRTGVIITPGKRDNFEFKRLLVEVWNATPFSEVEVSATINSENCFIEKESVFEFKKGHDMVKYVNSIPRLNENCTIFNGINLIWPKIFEGKNKLVNPEIIVTMKAINKLTREKTIMFFTEYIINGLYTPRNE